MKNTYKWLATAMLLLITTTIQAQPEWQWGKRGGSSGSIDEKVIDMATDQNGNVYVLAVNAKGSTANVDGHTGIGPGDQVSVASWNCSGEFRWMKTLGGDLNVIGTGFGVDTLGGVYITGFASSDIGPSTPPTYLDTDTVLSFTRKTMYLVKYDTSGNFQWLKMPEPDTIVQSWGGILDMDVAPNGDLYLYSLLRPGSLDGGAFIVPDTGMYVWKTDKDGVYQNLTKLDITVSGSASYAHGYATLNFSYYKRDELSGSYYICGFRQTEAGTLRFGATDTVPQKKYYVSAFNKIGVHKWTKINTGNGLSGIRNHVVNNEYSDIFVGGGAGSGLSFNGYVFTSTTGSGLPFVIAMDSSGNLLWGSHGIPQNAQCVTNAVEYSNGILAAAGYYGGVLAWDDHSISTPINRNYIFLNRLNATTGNIIGIDSIPTYGLTNNPTAITSDKNGNFYVGGRFDNAIFVAEDTLFKIGGSYDWFVAKFGTANCNCTIPTANFSYTTSGTAINFSYTGSTDYTNISWDFGDGSTSSLPNPSHTFSDTASHTVCVTVSNDCGSNVYCLEVTAPTGIESTSTAAVKVYPNPANSSITVEGAGSGTRLMLYEVTGKLALEQTLRNSRPVNLNISHLPDGVYLLQFTDSKGRRGMTKVVKR